MCVRERETRHVAEREVEWQLRNGSCRTLAGDACVEGEAGRRQLSNVFLG